jgi:hypothetical protein
MPGKDNDLFVFHSLFKVSPFACSSIHYSNKSCAVVFIYKFKRFLSSFLGIDTIKTSLKPSLPLPSKEVTPKPIFRINEQVISAL